MAAAMARLRAVIFDFDGLLADTEALHSRMWRRVLLDCGVEVSIEEYADHWIRRGRGIVEFVQDRALPHEPDALLARKTALYLAAIGDELREMPGALGLLDAVHGRIPLALVTSGRRAQIEPALRRLGMAGRFDALVTYEMVSNPKPHPEPFLLGASLLGVEPAACVALEDAEKGVISAATAGMAVIAVPNEHTVGHDFSRASAIVPSLREVTFETLEGLLAGR
jgi:HAD superfamily hydrolase (TIGR01509 family)